MPAVMTKDRRQPKSVTSQDTSKAPTRGPARDPLIQMAEARPRSDRGAHSRMTLLAPGLTADSPTPRPSRLRNRVDNDGARPLHICAIDHRMIAPPIVRRVPSQSVIAPHGSRHNT